MFDHPWLGGLFGDAEVQAAWSAERQLAHYLAFEAALARALEVHGFVEEGVGQRASTAILAARPDPAGLAPGTARDGVCIPHLVAELRAVAGPDRAAVHFGLTSQDVIDSALALTLREITDVLVARLDILASDLAGLAQSFGQAPLMGRTRMQAALPMTVGDRVASWSAPLEGHVHRLRAHRGRVALLQLGGAVGTRHAWGGKADLVAADMARDLGLDAPAGAWHSDRSALGEYASTLSLISGSLGKMGQDIALMAQQGVDEVRLSAGGGSSAMPHKANPILAELLVTLARFNSVQVAAMHAALVHEQERSGAAWSLEWMVLPSMTAATGRGLEAARELVAAIERIGTPG